MRWSVEAKVGLVTVVGVIMFTFVVVTLAHTEIFGKPGYEVHAMFPDANGLQKGNSVRYVGVHVGRVEDVVASKDGVDVKLKIDKDTPIPADSEVTIATDGLMGEKIVNIAAGKSKNRLVQNGDYLIGNSGKSMNDLMESSNQLIGSVQTMVDNFNKILGNQQNQESIKSTLQNVANLTVSMNDVVAGNSGNIQAMTANMVAITSSMNGVASQLEQSATSMDGDGAMSQNMRSTVENMKTITDRIDHIARTMEGVTTSPQGAADIQKTLHNTAQISDKLNNILSGNNKMKVQGEAGLLYNGTKSHTGANVNFKFFHGSNFALLGAEDIGSSTKLDLQYGIHGNGFDQRIGLINGSLGAGFDFGLDKPFRVSLEAYDPDDWRYRLKTQIRIMPDVYLFGQFTRPMSREDGGNYYGVNYTF